MALPISSIKSAPLHIHFLHQTWCWILSTAAELPTSHLEPWSQQIHHRISQIVRRLLKRLACCKKIQYWKGKGNSSCRCFPPTDQKYLSASKRMKSYPTTNCPASPRASHPKFPHPPTKVKPNLSNNILPISTSSKNAWWSQANIKSMTSILTMLWFSL